MLRGESIFILRLSLRPEWSGSTLLIGSENSDGSEAGSGLVVGVDIIVETGDAAGEPTVVWFFEIVPCGIQDDEFRGVIVH